MKQAADEGMKIKYKAEVCMLDVRMNCLGLVLGLKDPMRLATDQPAILVIAPSAATAPDTTGTNNKSEEGDGKEEEKKDEADGAGATSSLEKALDPNAEAATGAEAAKLTTIGATPADGKEGDASAQVLTASPAGKAPSSVDSLPPAKRAAKVLKRFLASFSSGGAVPPSRSYRNLISLGFAVWHLMAVVF